MKAPMSFSYSSIEREKQIVLRANRLIRVRSVRLLRSIRWVKAISVMGSLTPGLRASSVAVGIAVTGYSPRGSGRALLTHPALTLGSGVKAVHWVRVDNSALLQISQCG